MYKLILVCLAVLTVAYAQYLASPYAYSGLYRSGAYYGNAYPYASVYSAGYPTAYAGYPYAYGAASYLYK